MNERQLDFLRAFQFPRKFTDRISLFTSSYRPTAIISSSDCVRSIVTTKTDVFEMRANVSDLTLRHELKVMDVKAAFHSALKNSATFGIAEFSTWPRLHEFKASRAGNDVEVLVKPDGFIRIHEKEKDGGISEHTFFLEVDRSTETQGTLVNRAACYLDYYKSGGFAVRNGAPRSAYKKFPFRVLIVLKSAERRNNTAERLLESNPPIFTLVHLSTSAEVIADPLGEIWVRPVDYRDAISGTPFDANQRERSYKRQSQRETLVERRLRKSAFLG